MPNWCTSRLEVRGPRPLLEAYLRATREPPGSWGPEGAHWPHLDFEVLDPTPGHVRGSQGENAWQQHRWGCKWGVSEGGGVAWDGTSSTVSEDFETPWAPPVSMIARIARAFPGLSLRLTYAEPGMGVGGDTVWSGGEQTASRTIEEGGGFAPFCRDVVGFDPFDGMDDPPEGAYDDPGPPPALPPAPARALEGALARLEEAGSPGEVREAIRALRAASDDPDRALLSAAPVAPVVDEALARTLVDAGRAALLRHARALTDRARAVARQAAIDRLTGPIPTDAARGEAAASAATDLGVSGQEGDAFFRRPARSEADRATRRWVDRMLEAARLLDQLLEGDTLDEAEARRLTEAWETLAGDPSAPEWAVQGQRRLVAHALIHAPGLSADRLERMVAEAPTGSDDWTALLVRPDLSRTALHEALEAREPSAWNEPAWAALAERARREEDEALARRVLDGARAKPDVWRALVAGGPVAWLARWVPELVAQNPEVAIEVIRRGVADDALALDRRWLRPLMEHPSAAVRREAILLARSAPARERTRPDRRR